MILEGGVFLASIEEGTEFGDVRKVAVTNYLGVGIGTLQFFQKMP